LSAPAGYLLDTNLISETRKLRADAGVTAFPAAADSAGLFLCVLTLGELRKGRDRYADRSHGDYP
jgi:predicted nucleic acid-binding protein